MNQTDAFHSSFGYLKIRKDNYCRVSHKSTAITKQSWPEDGCVNIGLEGAHHSPLTYTSFLTLTAVKVHIVKHLQERTVIAFSEIIPQIVYR